MRFTILFLSLLLLATPVFAGEPISGAAFTLEGPMPTGCSFLGAKAAGTQGYPVLALSDNECACVESWFHDTSAVNWRVTPVLSVGFTEPTNNNGCLEATVTVYTQDTDLTALGSPSATTIEDDNVGTLAGTIEYMDTSANIEVYDRGDDAPCTKPACDNRLARICLKRVTTGSCGSNDYPGDLLIEALFVNKTP